MTRSYTAEPVESVVVDEILDLARRGPSAGKTDSLQFLVLDGADVARYWDTTLPVDKDSAYVLCDTIKAEHFDVGCAPHGGHCFSQSQPVDLGNDGLLRHH